MAWPDRRRERFPEASVYNRLCDREWDPPEGEASACGGDALIRWTALQEVGGYNPALIAGEEPEMCVRLRARGWQVWRLDADMTRFGQRRKCTRCSGHAAAEGIALHRAPPEHHGVAQVRRALIWGLALPGLVLAGSLATPWSLTLLLAWPAQVTRLALRDGGTRGAWKQALFLTLGKIPEALGVLEYWARRRLQRPTGLIEYK